MLAVCALAVPAQKLKADEIIAKHLDSIGTAAIRAAVKNQIVVGDVQVSFVTPKSLPGQGRVVMASEGGKNFFGLNLNLNDYPFEKFSYDGKKVKVSFIRPGIHSLLGNLLASNELMLEDSLFGGTLSSSWALLNTPETKAKLSADGTKKIDDRETYVIGYSPKGGGDFDIKMYFDKETFRHVRTEYKRVSSASIGRTSTNTIGRSVDDSGRQLESRIKLVEDFSDFRAEKGVMLPHAYRLNYSISGQNGTTEVEWKFTLTEFGFNLKLDPKTFDIEM